MNNKLRRSEDNLNRLSSLNLWDHVSEQDKSLANVFRRYGLCFGHLYAGAKIAGEMNLLLVSIVLMCLRNSGIFFQLIFRR